MIEHKHERDFNTLNSKQLIIYHDINKQLNLNFYEAYNINKYSDDRDITATQKVRLSFMDKQNEELIAKKNKLLTERADYNHWSLKVAEASGLRVFRHKL